MTDFHDPIELDARAAWTIAAGMRAVANADGEHPNELALIQAFEAELPTDLGLDFDLGNLGTDGAKEVFLKSCVLVALADGRMSEEEVQLINSYAHRLGLPEEVLTDLIQQVSVVMLSHFTGVTHFKDQVVAVGRALGVEDETIDRVLATGG